MERANEPLSLAEAGKISNPIASRCARCGATFACGRNGPEPCWCTTYPRVMPVPQENAGCYCPACLAELTKRR